MIDKVNGYQPYNTMREVLRDNSLLVMTVSRFGIPFGFGDERVDSICRDAGVDTDTFITVCNLLSGYPYIQEHISLHCIIEYLKRAHTSFLDVSLPKIRHSLIEAICRNDNDEITMLLIRFFDDYVIEVKRHMDHENNVVFPYVENLVRGECDGKFNIARYSESHGHAAAKLNELKDLFIYHYSQKENARLSATLFEIVMCEKDLMSHFEVESRLFVPAVERMEEELKERIGERHTADDGPQPRDTEDAISAREKEIIRCVACGKSNKEIAEQLFISPHTVATHRRNINSKLGIHSATGLTIYAIIHNIIDAKDIKL